MRDYDTFEGPTDEELTEAYRRYNRRRVEKIAEQNGRQSSGRKLIGVPRRAKHKGLHNVNGVRVR